MSGEPTLEKKVLSRAVAFPAEVIEDCSWMTPLMAWLSAKWAEERRKPQFTGVLAYLGELEQ